jgi:hypothetical protein
MTPLPSPPAAQPPAGLVHALLRTLIDQLRAAPVYVPMRDDELPGWTPVPADCHGNVDRWCALHPGDTAVRGWLHEPFAGQRHRFLAHSVVLTTAGELLDVTLRADTPPLRFLGHPGPEADFFAFLRCPYPFHELAQPLAGMGEFPWVPPDDSPTAEPGVTGFPEENP